MKRTVVLIVVLTVIAAALVIIALQTNKPKVAEKAPGPAISTQPTPIADTTLQFSPSTVTLGSAGSKVDVLIDTGKNTINGVQLEIAYDPNVLTGVDITPGSFLKSPLTLLDQHDSTTGRISYALVLPPGGEPIQGTGVVATLTFSKDRASTNTATQTQILLLDKSLITETGGRSSLLKDTSDATVIIATPSNTEQPGVGTSSGTPTQ